MKICYNYEYNYKRDFVWNYDYDYECSKTFLCILQILHWYRVATLCRKQ